MHGDLHGHNQVWDQQRLRLVADWETSGARRAEYDLRYLAALGPGISLLVATAKWYTRRAGWPLRLLMLPRGHAPGYVDELAARFNALQIDP